MSTYGGSHIIKDGLVFGYDADDKSERFYKGEPTINYIYHQNPRIDYSYVSANLSSYGGTIVAKHPGAIRVYNINNTELTPIYYNGGVSDPTNNQHAYWVYDEILKKPVVQMIDTNGSWMAKVFNCGMNAWSTYGMSIGSQYTISWMQWTSNIAKRASVGVYCKNSSGSYSFWDGQGGATSYNTLSNVWQKCYYTFTISSSHDISVVSESIYMYGMNAPLGTLRISDVQLEFKSHPTQFTINSRLSTNSLLDLTGKNIIDLSHASFDSTAHPYFNNVDSYITVPNSSDLCLTSQGTISVWTYFNSSVQKNYANLVSKNSGGSNGTLCYSFLCYYGKLEGAIYNGGINNKVDYLSIPSIGWHHLVFKWDTKQLILYVDGVLKNSTVQTINAEIINTPMTIGGRTFNGAGGVDEYFNGKIPIVHVYNRALSENEILQNYYSIKNRFNI